MEFPYPCYRPTLDPAVAGERLGRLLVSGPIVDTDLDSRIARLDERFRAYAATSPYGMWAPGLVITPGMKSACEASLPLNEIGSAFRRLLAFSLRFEPSLHTAVFNSSLCWLDLLHRLRPLVREANPASLLRRLMADGEFRCRFLFALFLPRHYGGGFDRYSEQTAFLGRWLRENRPSGEIRCLDAACGSGEGSYDLVRLLLESGCDPRQLVVHGVTIEPLELFAGAHGWFPHDPLREDAFRRRIGPLLAEASGADIRFYRKDLAGSSSAEGEWYDIVICNGILGGPFMSSAEAVKTGVRSLCARLRRGGVFMAADRFHGGWKRTMSGEIQRETVAGCGMQMLAVPEGVAGVKAG